MISFKANYLNHTNIKQYDLNNKTSDYQAFFIKIDPNNRRDLAALRQVKKDWGSGSYAHQIYDRATEMAFDDSYARDKEIFALTTQANDFAHLQSDKILGLSLLSSRPHNIKYITYFQTIPKYTYEKRKELSEGFKNIGTSLLDCLKTYVKNSSITLHATFSSMNFYLSQGFDFINKDSKYMNFVKKI